MYFVPSTSNPLNVASSPLKVGLATTELPPASSAIVWSDAWLSVILPLVVPPWVNVIVGLFTVGMSLVYAIVPLFSSGNE